ncbi:MAG: autotransporter assembly complex family protein [Thermodesulfovibrionales bacterium]
MLFFLPAGLRRSALFRLNGVSCRFFLLLSGLLLCLALPGPARADPVVHISVEGVEGDLLENILGYLSIEQHKKDADLSEEDVRRLYEQAPEEIRSALQPFGFYKPDITSALSREEGAWRAHFQIAPGPAVRIRTIDLAVSGPGSGDPRLERLREDFPVKEGQVLQHEKYEKAKRMLQETAAERGYLDAEFLEHKVVVHREEYYAVVELHLATGPLYHFGEVTFHQEALRPEFMVRFLPFRAGDPYRISGLLDLQSALYESDYFSEVEVMPRKDLAEDLVIPVEVFLEPRKRQKYVFGIGYGTDTGVRGILGWENRRVNRRGHKFTAELNFSEIRGSLTSRYTIPMKHPVTDHFDISAGFSQDRTETSRSATRLLGVSYTQVRGKWQETFYLNFQQEKFTISDESGDSTLLLPGTNWVRVKADNRINTTNGSRLLLDLRGAHTALVSDTSFVQARVNAKVIRSLGSIGRIILRGDVGTTQAGDFSRLPPSQRFFAGGDQSVRGYAYNSLGPESAEGKVIGGKHLLVGSVEYEQHIVKKWSAAVFFDAGNALARFSGPLEQGAGFGVRWKSPVGPVRVDLAWALSKPGTPWRIHITMGPDL